MVGVNLTMAQVLAAFTKAVEAHGGRVQECFCDEARLFTRSLFPHADDVRPRDKLQGGVALRADADGLWLHPYVFRLVCRNGAILAKALETRSMVHVLWQDPAVAEQSIREGVAACCEPEVFAGAVEAMRRAARTPVDLAITLMPLAQAGATSRLLLTRILADFHGGADPSQFGLANAITAVARRTRDPGIRWNLEELGGAMATMVQPEAPSPRDSGRSMTRRATSARKEASAAELAVV